MNVKHQFKQTNMFYQKKSLNCIFNDIVGGLETLRRLHTLKLSHNQLINTTGLGDTPTLQVLDISANHLQAVEDIEKLCLLLSLDVSANNILKVIHILVLIASISYFPFIMLYQPLYPR